MARRRHCHNKVRIENFFQFLRRERMRSGTYPTRNDPRRDTFDYIAILYNPKCKQTNNIMPSPDDCETP